MPPGREVTITEAKALAEQWEAQAQDHCYAASLQARFRDTAPSAVIRMWESGKNEHGKKLTRFELLALVERWGELFGCLPPSDSVTAPQARPVASKPEDDKMLGMSDVVMLMSLALRNDEQISFFSFTLRGQ
jgi:hypothetical protein